MDEFTSPPAPVQAVAAPPPPTTARTVLLARIGLLGIATAALVAVGILVFGSGASPVGTLAAGSGTQTTPLVEDLMGLAGGRGFAHAFGGITITAISGSNIALETVDGWTRTITVDADTEYSKSGDDITLGDLAVGDQIAFRQTREDDGTWTIDAIAVIPPHVGGEVTAVSGSTITVEQRDGTTATITVNADTETQVDGDDAALEDVEVGMYLVAQGVKNADGSLTATEVKAADPDSFRGPGGFGRHGFKSGFGFGPGLDWHDDPDATEAPSATDSAS